MDLHEAWKLAAALGIAIHRSHHGFLPLENTDTITQDLQYDAVLFSPLEDFDIERLCPHIEASPEPLPRLRHIGR